MISGLNPANERFIASLNDLQSRLNQTQNQLSSGLRVNQASDAPQSLGDIFQTRAELANTNQISENLNLVKAQVNAGDTTLQGAISLLDNALSLGAQGSSSLTTAGQQNALAQQVQSLLSAMVGLSRTQVNGVYIFSGDASSSPAYQLNPASPTGVDRLITAPATQQVADPAGLTFQISMTAQDLFDHRDVNDQPDAQNVFAALNGLQLALQGGNTATIAQALDGIHTASAYLNQQLGFYGATENRIASAIDLAQKFQLQGQTQLSNLQDADVPALAVRLTQDSTSLNAALAAQAKRPTSTLFDFLPVG